MSAAASDSVRSMTGFGSMEHELADGRTVSVRVKGVNARHLELQMRLPSGLDGLEMDLRALVKSAVRRGHVEVTISAERGPHGSAVQVNEALLAGYIEAHRRAAARFDVQAEPDLNAFLRLPGVMTVGVAVELDAAAADGVKAVLLLALQQFNEARLEEGRALAAEMRAAVGRLQQLAEEAAQLRREVSVSAVVRLRTRMMELTATVAEVPPERLLAEAALLVARGDVEEELVRLRTHLGRFIAILEAGGEVGKPLEFLLQELNREANTLLSKTGGAAGEAGLRLTDVGLAMKVELERAREQVQNLE